METKDFFDRIKQNPRPVVVDLWAPWCGPCRMVKPVLEKLAQEYDGRVDLWEINADESQDLLRELKVHGIPTLIVYRDGNEALRQVGAKPASTFKALFESLATGQVPAPSGLSNPERLIRMGLGAGLLVLSSFQQFNGWLLGTGALLIFSAVYDRCPIWRALSAQFKKITAR